MQTFEQESIPRIHESASENFRFRENIAFFLAACEMIGVPKAKLFHVNDLWENTSMVNVVDCLFALAQTVASKWPNKYPDIHVSHDNDEALLASLTEEERLEVWRQAKSKANVATQRERRKTVGYRLSMLDVAGEVEQMLKSVDPESDVVFSKGITRCQAVFRGIRERVNYQNRLRDSAYRERVVFEILSTEQTYVESLRDCLDVYLRPLEAAVASGKPIITEDKVEVIFKGLATIADSNTTFLNALRTRLQKWHPNLCVGDVIVSIEAFLDKYTEYIQNYTEAVRLFKREQRKRKGFKEFLSKQKLDPRAKGRNLDQFLIMPVQRIPRYHLLLRELVKHTWTTHPDYEALDAAVDRLANIAMFLNEKKREAEALQRTFHVQSVLDKAGVNLQVAMTGRKYLHEGELYDMYGKAVVVYLFNDLLIVCGDKNDRAHTEADERRANKSKIKFSEFLMLEADMVVVDVVDIDSSGKPSFLITLPNQRKTLQLHAATPAIKKEWIEVIRSVHAKLSALAILGSPTAAEGSPQISTSGRISTRKKSGVHRRQKSSADDTSRISTTSAPATPVTPTLQDKAAEKKRFFPLPSPRGERIPAAATLTASANANGSANSSGGSTPQSDGTNFPGGEEVTGSRKASRKGTRLGALSSAIPSDVPDDDTQSGSGDEKSSSSGIGSIRVRMAAVMRLTNLNKLFEKDDEGKEGSGGVSTIPVAPPPPPPETSVAAPETTSGSSSSVPNVLPSTTNSTPAAAPTPVEGGGGGGGSGSNVINKRETDNMAKLQQLMRARQPRKDDDGETEQRRHSGRDFPMDPINK